MAEYDGSDTLQRTFIYGNYIDEVLLMKVGANEYYYSHDHLYSPVALTDYSGSVLERYEYDAYGNPTIWNAGFTTKKDAPGWNPYLFTGRRTDYLDSGSLKIQYNRNRYYDYYSGRWLTHDPLGITPNAQWPNRFGLVRHYKHGVNLYGYVRNDPIRNSDAYGLFHPDIKMWMPTPPCGTCGMKFPLSEFHLLEETLKKQLDAIIAEDPNAKDEKCKEMYDPKGWDWLVIHNIEDHQDRGCGCGAHLCKATVEVNGKCYNAHELNYYLWGLANRLCGHSRRKAVWSAYLWGTLRPDRAYCKKRWTEAGYDGKVSIEGCTVSYCKTGKCKKTLRGSSPYVKGISKESPYIKP